MAKTSNTPGMDVKPSMYHALTGAYMREFERAEANRTYNGYDVPIVGERERLAGMILLTMANAER